jgi:hypothetical protein
MWTGLSEKPDFVDEIEANVCSSLGGDTHP